MIKILNSSPGFGSVLSEQEVKNFLTNNKYNIHLGTVDEKGHPNIHPTWYYFEALNHKFYVETSKHSKYPMYEKMKACISVLMIRSLPIKECVAKAPQEFMKILTTIYLLLKR